MGLVQTVDEPVDLVRDRVEVEARAIRRCDAEPGHQRLAAVVPGANGDAVHVEDLRDVVRMDAFDVERDDSRAPVRRRPVADEARHVGKPLERVDEQLALVLLDRSDADIGDVVDRGAESHGFRDRLRSGLELVRQLAPGRLLERDRPDHVTAEVERRHRLEQLRPAPERTDARRAAHLVGGESEEVAVELLDVDRVVWSSLRRVDDHDRPLLVGPRGEPLDRIDRAERVRDEVVGDDLDLSRAARSHRARRA